MQKILKDKVDSYVTDAESKYSKSVSYYNTHNDIENDLDNYDVAIAAATDETSPEIKKDLIRHANNTASSNFHQILVDQEAGYLATSDPAIDVGDDKTNRDIKELLGDDFSLTLNKLIVDASNAGQAWLHYWTDNNKFKFAVVPPDQIYPIYSTSLNNDLKGVIRVYKQTDMTTGDIYKIVEYWNDTTCTTYRKKDDNANAANQELSFYDRFQSYDQSGEYPTGATHIFNHGLGDVPFICFSKNINKKPELDKYKKTIDIYDKVYNGFANDLEDIQQTILILKGFGGAKIAELWRDIQKNKAIKLDPTGFGNEGVDKLNIDIPVDAKNAMLALTRQKIFDDAQGIDPQNFMTNSAISGKAIKGLYASLELKATTTEKYFRPGLAKLVRAILRYKGVSAADTMNISQTWTRTAVQNDLEQSEIARNVAAFTSKRNLAKINPAVDDVDQELQYEKQEEVEDGFSDNDAINRYARDASDNSEDDE